MLRNRQHRISVIALILIKILPLGLSSNAVRLNDTKDDVIDVLTKSFNIVWNMTRPALDNEIKRETLASFNTTILAPMNVKLEEHEKQIQYEKSSILLLNSDVTLMKDSLMDLTRKTDLIDKRQAQMKTTIDLMDIRTQHVLNDTNHLKSKINDLKTQIEDQGVQHTTELKTLNIYMQNNSADISKLEISFSKLETSFSKFEISLSKLETASSNNTKLILELAELVKNKTGH